MSAKEENIKDGNNILVDNGAITVINEGISLAEKEKENINNILAEEPKTDDKVDLTPDVKITPKTPEIPFIPDTPVIDSVASITTSPQIEIPTPTVEDVVPPIIPDNSSSIEMPVINNDIKLSDSESYQNRPIYNDNNFDNGFNNDYNGGFISNYNSYNNEFNSDVNSVTSSYSSNYDNSNQIYDLLKNIQSKISDSLEEIFKKAIEEVETKGIAKNLKDYEKIRQVFSNFVDGNTNNRRY